MVGNEICEVKFRYIVCSTWLDLQESKNKLYRMYIMYSLLLEDFGRYEPRECLVVFSFSVRLPPVGILLVDDVQNVSLLEGDAELAAWNVDVFLRVVIKVCSYMDLDGQYIIFDNTNFKKLFQDLWTYLMVQFSCALEKVSVSSFLIKNNYFLLTNSVLPRSLVLTVSGISFPHGTIRNVRVPVILACK